MPETGDELGRYRIERELGAGGMGVVYLAHDLKVDRQVALKVISRRLADDADFRTRFDREATTLARLDSPHIIAIWDHGEYDGRPYIATQYAAGGDLGTQIATRGALDPAYVLEVSAQIAGALYDAHEAGIVHRDVKPANVLLRDSNADEPIAFLCDFGIAQTEVLGLTSTGAITGTWAYLAPERIDGSGASPASDMYAVGCLLWEALTGMPPYLGSPAALAIAHVSAPVPQLPGDDLLSRGLNAVLAATLAKDPADRYRTAAALRADLIRLRTFANPGEPLPPPPAAPLGAATTVSGSPAPRRRRRAGPAVAVSTAVVLLLAVGSGIGYVLSRPDDPAANDRAGNPSAPSSGPGSEEPSPSASEEPTSLSADDREEVTAEAKKALKAALNIDYRTFDADIRAATERMTPSLAKEHRSMVGSQKLYYRGAKARKTGTITHIGITSGRPDRVDLFAFVDETERNQHGGPATREPITIWATMLRGSSRWLLSLMRDWPNPYDGPTEPQLGRRAALVAARQTADALNDVDWRDLQARDDRIAALTTADFDATLSPGQEQDMVADVLVVRGDPQQVALVTYTGKRATALATWEGRRTVWEKTTSIPERRYLLTLEQVGGVWLTAGVTPVS